MRIKVEMEEQKVLFDFNAFLDSPHEMIERILIQAVIFSQGSFERQGLYEGKKWWPPGPINKAAIWKDLNQGKNIKARHVDPNRKALMNTGKLVRSITWRMNSETEGQYGTNVSYASNQFHGTDMRLQKVGNPAEIAKKIEKFLKKHGSSLREKDVKAIRRMKKSKFLRVKIPARPFLGIPGEQVLEIVSKYIDERF